MNPKKLANTTLALSLLLGVSLLLAGLPAEAAENLRLKDGISFSHDLDTGFPILGDKMDDMILSADHPTFVFFGASGDLNTNRQAKRIVDLYKKYRSNGVKFVIIDVDKPANQKGKDLIKAHYQGYIPTQVVFDASGKSKWSKAGEVETSIMANELDKLL